MDEKIKKYQTEAENIVSQFKKGQNYKNTLRILQHAKKSIDYFEGRQWDDYNGSNKDEKITMNIIKPTIESKLSSTCNKQYKLIFSVDNDMASTQKLTKFTAYTLSTIKQNQLNYKMAKDSLLKGSGFKYFYWNEDKVGEMGKIEGGIEASIIDVKDIVFANPNETDIQKQEYIIVRSRENIKAIKNNCEILNDKEKEEFIVQDNYVSIYSKDVEQEDNNLCYQYTKFFRKDGEVYFEKCTSTILFQEPTSMNPLNHEKEIGENEDKNINETLDIDFSNNSTNELKEEDIKYTKEERYQDVYKANIYPFSRLVLEERDGSIYGLSYAFSMIPIQRSVNQLIMTTQYGASKSIMPTVVVKDGAFNLQKINLAKGGEVLIDKSGFGVPINNVISTLQQGSLPTQHYQLAQSLTSFMKDTYKASDVLDDGRGIAKGLSGDAISNLTYLQEKPIAQWQERLSETIQDEGKILEMFYKLYYRQTPFSYELTDSELLKFKENNKELINEIGIDNITTTQPDLFDGEEYLQTPFHIKVEVMETSKSSEQSELSILQMLFLNGVIKNLSNEDLLMFATLINENAFPRKDEFKRLVMERNNTEVAKLTQIVEQLSQQNQQLQNTLQQATQKYNVENKNLKKAFTSRINAYNEQLRQLGIMNKDTQNKAVIEQNTTNQ